MTGRVRLGMGVLLLPLLMSCSFGGGREKDLADQIRGVGSAMVSSVVYRPQNLFDAASVDVYVRAETSEEQAADLWCSVVAPVGGTHETVFLWASDGTSLGSTAACDP